MTSPCEPTPGTAAEPLAADPLAAELMAAERACTAVRIARLERDLEEVFAATSGANTDDEHDPEGATIAFERAQLITLLEHARRRQLELEHAQERLDAGTYGTCEGCGQQIPPGRLAARPASTRCVACADHAPRRR